MANYTQPIVQQLKLEISHVDSQSFVNLALKLFKFQLKHCEVYSDYVKYRGIDISAVDSLEKIPFLPISFFKTNKILNKCVKQEAFFESSGTTGENSSKHYVADTAFYKKISENIFQKNYGSLENYHFIAMLPSYLERGNSSLVYMVKHFIEQSNSSFSGFYLSDYEAVMDVLKKIIINKSDSRKIILWGVTYALLEMLETGFDFTAFADRLIVLETGGMKGRRREMVKEELYSYLKAGFNVKNVHSEYGMTELLSQAYSQSDALFFLPETMRIMLREVNDPFNYLPKKSNKTGGINIIDLANIESCCFIETQDLGQYGEQEGSFKVLGRFDNSDLRGCNLMVN